MPRVKRSVAARKKRRKVLGQAKGYWGLKKSSYRYAKEQVEHSLVYAYRGRVDPHDPEAAERALLGLAVAIGVDERVLDLLLRVAVARLLEPPVALRVLQDLAPLLAGMDGSLDARQRLAPPQQFLDDVRVALGERVVLTERPLPLWTLLLQQVALHRAAAQHLARSRHFEPLLRSAVC